MDHCTHYTAAATASCLHDGFASIFETNSQPSQPKRTLSTLIPSDVIREMNRAVEEMVRILRNAAALINTLEPSQIGKYAVQLGAMSDES